MESTNQKLKVLIEQHKADPNLRVDPVGMVLNGVVDAAVSGESPTTRFVKQTGPPCLLYK